MDPIPFLKSPVAIGAMVSLITGLLAAFGRNVPNDVITGIVTHVLDAIATLSAAFALYKRWRSPIQPLAVNQASADKKTAAIASGGVRGEGPPAQMALAMLAPAGIALFAISMVSTLAACSVMATSQAKTLEQKGAALLGDFTLYQRASVKIGEDTTVPDEVRRTVLTAEIAAKPVADKLDEALRQYRTMKTQLAAGATTDDKVKIAAGNLQSWIEKITPLVSSLRKNVEAASP